MILNYDYNLLKFDRNFIYKNTMSLARIRENLKKKKEVFSFINARWSNSNSLNLRLNKLVMKKHKNYNLRKKLNKKA